MPPQNTSNHGNSVRIVKLPRHRLRMLAKWVYNASYRPARASTPANPITVVCVSDTHNNKPTLPAGDLILHAGDLTEWGTFSELQEQLTWISSQPHKYRVIVAGNHDVLLDSAFLDAHPEYHRNAPDTTLVDPGDEAPAEGKKTHADLDFGDCIYLNDETVTLKFPRASDEGAREANSRSVTVYGSPKTPAYGISAFQYPRSQDVWTDRISANSDVDIVISHGPAYGHLDGTFKSGDPCLAKELARARPRLLVCGHIHVGYGTEDVVMERQRRRYEGIVGGWGGWIELIAMSAEMLLQVLPWPKRDAKVTTFVNAAVVGGNGNELVNAPVVVNI